MSSNESSRILRVLSYNIHKGFSPANKTFVLREMKEAVKQLGADLLFLQEVQGEHHNHAKKLSDWPDESQFEFLADGIWPHFSYGKNSVYDHGHHGNAILSRFPILSSENIDISAHRFESRGMLHALIQIEDGVAPLHCLCVHLGFFATGKRFQIGRILDRVKHTVPLESSLVIAGDFNDWSRRATKRLQDEIRVQEIFYSVGGRHVKTYPSVAPIFSLDRIYQRGFTVNKAKVLFGAPWSGFSDHAALYAEVEFDPGSLLNDSRACPKN